MALFAPAKPFKSLMYLLLLAAVLSCANSARLLDDVDPQDPFIDPPVTPDLPTAPITSPATTSLTPSPPEDDEADPPVIPTDDDVAAPVADTVPITPPVTATSPIPNPTSANPTTQQTTTSASYGTPSLSFFLHDIIGGTHPSARVVTGIIARADINGIPFSQPNNNFFPLQGGTPLTNINNINNLINPNTAPLITGLNNVQTSTVLQNTGNNNNVFNGNNQPFVTAGQLPTSSALQKLMFGSITVVDDELTEGHELGSGVIGKAQGFYLASSLDGNSHTLSVTAILHGDDHHDDFADTISFFGIHRTASVESQIAVIGGSGKYENAKGFATIETIHQENQHTTDGVDTIMHFNVYLSE